ncbi:MAG: serine/threonine-protein kinase [Polyangia bacterium]
MPTLIAEAPDLKALGLATSAPDPAPPTVETPALGASLSLSGPVLLPPVIEPPLPSLSGPAPLLGAATLVSTHPEDLPALPTRILEPAPAAPVAAPVGTFSASSTAASAPAAAPVLRDTLPTQREITVLPLVELQGQRLELVRRSASRYEKLRDLGSGAMGEVTLARDNDIGRTVAVKRLIRRSGSDHAGLLRFIAEVRTVGQLEHPNIVPIHDVGLDENGNYYFVMKYVDGETLERIVDKLAAGDPLYHQRYPVEVRLEIFLGLLRALQYAHDQGIVHRDIKPANVMVGPYGEVVLMDWGIAKQIRGGERLPDAPAGPVKPDAQVRLFATRNDQLIGTPAYMAPEQAMGRNSELDERSDIYSATVVLHELLCLRHYLASYETLEGMLLAIATEPFPYMKLIFVRHPQHPVPRSELLHFIARGLAKRPEDRFQSVIEMIAELQRLIDGRCGVRCPATLAKRSLREVASFVDRFPKLSPFVFYPAVMFLLFCVASTLYRLLL